MSASDAALARLEALERLQLAVDRLAEGGPLSELIERAPEEAAGAIELDRALLSRVEDGRLLPDALHCREGAGDAAALLASLQAQTVQLEYPLLEAEMLRRRRARIVPAGEEEASPPRAYGELMRWGEYVASPILLGGRVVGFLHGDRNVSRKPLREFEGVALERFAKAFAAAFERAVLRRRLRIQQQELRAVASWADARTSELSDSAIDLAVEREEGEERASARSADSRLRELVTKRELEVLEHMVKGGTNAEIARALVVSEETVKFHVKNILRKLGASNRAEASSRYLRLLMREDNGAQGVGQTRRLI